MNSLPTRRSIRSCSGSRDGIALVTVLAFIVLLTILIISFISFTRLNRLATGSYSRSIQAQEVALGGMQDIVSDLRQEITAGSTNYTVVNALNQTNIVHVPLTNLTAVPTRVGYAANLYTNDLSPTYLPPTLVRVSRASSDSSNPGNFTPNFTTNSYFDQTLVKSLINRASAANTTTASVDGRKISAARWNKISLLATNSIIPDAFSTNTPDWVYVTRTGSRACTKTELQNGSLGYTANVATNYFGATPPSAGTIPPPSPVVGRYAYVVYDEGALLDANVAGYTAASAYIDSTAKTNLVSYPADATTGMTQAVNGKSYLSYADLTQLPGFSGAQSIIDSFVNWRNASVASVAGSVPTGQDYLLSLISYSKSGFLNFQVKGSGTSAISDSPLLGRQDLINYFANLDKSGSTSYSSALPYLGTFSRAVSAPSYLPPTDASILATQSGSAISSQGPAGIFSYHTNADKSPQSSPFTATRDNGSPVSKPGPNPNQDMANVRFANGGTIIHYPDDGTISAATLQSSYSYAVNAGDPLLQTRFSLAKINWLSQADPVAGTAPTGNYPAAIQACFGLVWGAPGTGISGIGGVSASTANGGNSCWNYAGSPIGTGGISQAKIGVIETLDQVALENREPNFFELLKAAILSGSLGLGAGPAVYNNQDASHNANNHAGSTNGDWSYDYIVSASNTVGVAGLFGSMLGTTTKPGPPAPATVPDMQIMQIGANIIDQFDADSYPTAIYFPYLTAVSTPGSATNWDPVAGQGNTNANAELGPVTMVYGDENLPLLNKIEATFCSPDAPNNDPSTSAGQTADKDAKYIEGWLQPEIWNPHQEPAAAPAKTPLNFEIRAYGAIYIFDNALHYDPSGTYYPNLYQASPPQLYYHGKSSTEVPSSTNLDAEAGTLIFKVDQNGLPFYSTPRLLTTDQPMVGESSVNVDTNTADSPWIGLPWTTAGSPTSYAQSNFPFYNRALSTPLNSTPTYTNHFAAFSAAMLGTDPATNPRYHVSTAQKLTDSPPSSDSSHWTAGVVGISVEQTAWTSPDVGAYPFPCVSFALGWFPAGHPELFHPYSFITGIFAQSEQDKDFNYPWTIVGAVQAKSDNELWSESWGLPDPRTNRFSHSLSLAQQDANTTIFPSFTDSSTIPFVTVPTSGSNPNFVSPRWTGTVQNDGFPQNWVSNRTDVPVPTSSFFVGGENRTKSGYVLPANAPGYYAGLDGVVRPGDGYYINTSTGDGNMLFTSNGNPTKTAAPASDPVSSSSLYNDATNVYHGRRPVILNRPFRSVGELGYVFRDEPFKTLDMFSKLSADAGLLDVFSITDESQISNNQISSVVAGQVNLSNAPKPIIQAILVGASKKDIDPTYNTGTEIITTAQNFANALNPSAGPLPLMNRAALVTQLQPTLIAANIASGKFNTPDLSNKAYLEAPVRALANVANTRTWNLLIDVIAQSGQMSSTATSLDNFVVQGERRYWLHVSIDRYTGKIVAEQLEPVYE